MGIPGLMSYISQRSGIFLKSFELHDTYLVIDGNGIVAQLYSSSNCNYFYGGDYGKYANSVSEFFDDLQKCKVTPIIIFDGALEDRKMNTMRERSKQRFYKVSISTPSNEQTTLPILAKDVFKYIVRQKNIKCIQSLFEADDHIASLARILNCPVLSFDSDFFIYNVMYIPYNTLKYGTFKNVDEGGFVKRCKIYRSEYLLQYFSGMDKTVLPLAAALLGNDYISTNIFNNFLSTIKISKKFKQEHSKKILHLKIEKVFRWLQYRTLDNAITIIIRKLDPEKRQSIIEVIEIIINGYLNPSSEMLGPLGYSQEEIGALMQEVPCESYKFQDLGDLEISKDREVDDETDLSSDENVENDILSVECIIIKPGIKNNIYTVPSWFMDKYKAAEFPAFFMDLIMRQMVFISEQMEDYSQPSCVNISLKMISVIYRLLSNGTSNSNTLKYITRGNGINVETYELDCKKYVFPFEIPTLEKLIDLPEVKRKQIFMCTLGATDELIAEFPPAWGLYIATIKYWLEETDSIFGTKCHLYALILAMILHVIKTVISWQSDFQNVHLQKNKNQDYNNKVQCFHSVTMPVKTALEQVTKNDCLQAMRFFESQTYISTKRFDITVIHSFSLFQSCLRSSINLNLLLGLPYPNVNVANFFSGVLMYNLYIDLKYYNNNLDERVLSIFKDSPSILQLFFSVSTKIQAMVKKQHKTST